MNRGTIFDIQRFCLHDGPGIRTVVFFKGCPLKCPWCCNPESQSLKPQLLYNQRLCLMCGRCLNACERGALALTDGKITIDRSACLVCGGCARVCPTQALRLCGKSASIIDVMEVLERDRAYYDISSGGATFSGGEATMQSGFLEELLFTCRDRDISTVLETCGDCDEDVFSRLAGLCDYVLFDIKLPDENSYKRYTGKNGNVVFKNLKTAAKTSNVVARIPLIPDVNMDQPSQCAFGRLLRDIHVSHVELIPYHRLGAGKYDALGSLYSMKDTLPPDADALDGFRSSLSSALSVDVKVVKT